MRFPLLLLSLILGSCAIKVEQAAVAVSTTEKREIEWPAWNPSTFRDEIADIDQRFLPNFIKMPSGEVVTYGRRPDGSEQIAIISKREENAKDGIFQFRQCFLPTSRFAGTSPFLVHTNELIAHDRKWLYSAYNYRSTFLELHPARTRKAKGLIVYHTSIMLLSVAEKQVVESFRKRGWNVLVGLPSDSLYRTKLPALASSRGTIQKAAQLVAEDMDRHYLEQANSTRVALQFLARTRPDWLHGKRVLIGTSAGTFGMPAEALMTPGWDALILVSGGTNLLSLYESGSAGVFSDSLEWVNDARRDPPTEVTRIFSNEEYHEIYRRASTMTKYHPGRLAPMLRNHRILMIAGTIDLIMPDEQAHGLHHALGRPERWTAPLGHHLIAVQLVLEVERIDRWIMRPYPAKQGL